MQVGQQFSGLPVELFKIDKPEPARLPPQPDIFRHGQIRNGTQLLLNNGDTGVQGFDRLMKLTAFAFDIDFPASGRIKPIRMLRNVDLPAPFPPHRA